MLLGARSILVHGKYMETETRVFHGTTCTSTVRRNETISQQPHFLRKNGNLGKKDTLLLFGLGVGIWYGVKPVLPVGRGTHHSSAVK